MFISVLYMFRTATFPSSGELIVSIRHLVYVTLCRGLSGLQTRRSGYFFEKADVKSQKFPRLLFRLIFRVIDLAQKRRRKHTGRKQRQSLSLYTRAIVWFNRELLT